MNDKTPLLTDKIPLTTVDSENNAGETQIVERHYNTIQEFPTFHEEIHEITLTWHEVNAFVPPPRSYCFRRATAQVEPKQILRKVSGIVKPGQLLAVMGASGAGKTTLLNVLNGRNKGSLCVEGDVRVNGNHAGLSMTALSGYVQQEDLFVPSFKVREHLVFQALLRMDRCIPQATRMRHVEEVIREFGLVNCADMKIGVTGGPNCISGGEIKRLAFASEVLTNPALLFCDEPTSGLDAFMAQMVVEKMKSLASKNKTILCTIHQPSSEVYAMFDRICFMVEGRIAFLGSPSEAIHFFVSMGFPCPNQFNPADYFVHTLAIVSNNKLECEERVKVICDAYNQSPYQETVIEEITLQNQNGMGNGFKKAFESMKPFKASWLVQFRLVLWRSMLNEYRDTFRVGMNLLESFIVGTILGLMYWQLPILQSTIQSFSGAIFVVVTANSFGHVLAVVNTFPSEVPIFRRDYYNGMYRVDVYFLCKTLARLPVMLLSCINFVSICYWMIGLYSTAEAYLIFVAIGILVAGASESMGSFISCVAPTIAVALAITIPLLVPFMVMGGFLISSRLVPWYFTWLQYVSLFWYANEAAMVNHWRNIDSIPCNNSSMSVPCFPNGDTVLSMLDYHKDRFGFDLVMLGVLLVGWRVLAFIAIFLRMRVKE